MAPHTGASAPFLTKPRGPTRATESHPRKIIHPTSTTPVDTRNPYHWGTHKRTHGAIHHTYQYPPHQPPHKTEHNQTSPRASSAGNLHRPLQYPAECTPRYPSPRVDPISRAPPPARPLQTYYSPCRLDRSARGEHPLLTNHTFLHPPRLTTPHTYLALHTPNIRTQYTFLDGYTQPPPPGDPQTYMRAFASRHTKLYPPHQPHKPRLTRLQGPATHWTALQPPAPHSQPPSTARSASASSGNESSSARDIARSGALPPAAAPSAPQHRPPSRQH